MIVDFWYICYGANLWLVDCTLFVKMQFSNMENCCFAYVHSLMLCSISLLVYNFWYRRESYCSFMFLRNSWRFLFLLMCNLKNVEFDFFCLCTVLKMQELEFFCLYIVLEMWVLDFICLYTVFGIWEFGFVCLCFVFGVWSLWWI